MGMVRVLFLSCVVFALVGTGPTWAQESFFPTVKAHTLNKDRITIPDDFSTDYNILLLSFGREMQEPVDAWDAALTPLRESSDQIQVYNTPLIPNPGALVRGFINGGFRGIYEDKALRDRIVILYVKEKEVFPVLNISEDDKTVPMVIVTAQDGRILGRVSGLADKTNLAAVQALVTPVTQ